MFSCELPFFAYYISLYLLHVNFIATETLFALRKTYGIKTGYINAVPSRTFALEIYSRKYDYNQICRFHNACIHHNGKIVIHSDWQAEESLLLSQCKDLDFEYINESVYHELKFQSLNLDLIEMVRKPILVYNNTTFHSFITQRYLQTYFALRLLQTPSQSLKLHQVICPSNALCPNKKFQTQGDLKPVIALPNKIFREDSARWLLRLFQNKSVSPVLVSENKLQPGLKCFNSVITFPSKIWNF